MKKFLLSLAVVSMSLTAMAETATFDFSNAEAIKEMNPTVEIPSEVSTGTNVNDIVFTVDGIEISGTAGSSTEARLWKVNDALQYRLYKGATLKVSSPESTITGITISCNNKGYLTGTGYESGTWSGSAKEVVLSLTGTVQISSIAVTYGEGGTTNPDQPGEGGDTPELPGDNGTVTFNFEESTYGAGPAYTDSNTAYVTTQNVASSNGVKVTFTPNQSGSNAWRFWNDGIRAYKGKNAMFTVSVPNGKVTNISWTAKNGATFALEGTTENITEWTGSQESVSFVYTNTENNLALITLTVQYEGGNGGNVDPEPDPDQPTVPTDAISVAEALSMIAAGSTATVKVQGIITSITEVSTNYGNATYEIKDAVSDAKGLTVFRGYWLNGEKFTAQNQIAVGGKVVVEGALQDYNGTPELNSGNKILSYEAPQQGEIPEPEVPTGDSVTFNFTDPDSLGIEFVPEQQENNLTGISITSGIVTLSFQNNGGTTEPRLWYASNSYTMRFYKDNEFTVSAAENYVLTGVEFDGTNIGKNWTWSSGSLISNTWIPEADSETSSVVFGKSATGDNPTVRKMTVYYDRATGVDSIMTEEGEAVYYNLQGVRVNNPERGIYIKVVGNKAVKVVK